MMNFKIRDLARSLFVSDQALFAVLSSYFDASFAEYDGNRITCVARYVAPLDEWERVETEWAAALADWKLDRFHFADLENAVGRERRDICIKNFGHIIRRSKLFAVGSAVVDDDWHRPDWGHDATPRFSSPYEKALDSALGILAGTARKDWPDQQISIVCDLDANQDLIGSAFARRRAKSPAFYSMTLATPSMLPIQCADLAVGSLRKSWLEIMAGERLDDMWGELPRPPGVTSATSMWSLKPAWFLRRSFDINQRRIAERERQK